MNKKIGRNDPCPCGSGKKYKQCCALKPQLLQRFKKISQITATPKKQDGEESSAPLFPNLMERTYGAALAPEQESRSWKASLGPVLPSPKENNPSTQVHQLESGDSGLPTPGVPSEE